VAYCGEDVYDGLIPTSPRMSAMVEEAISPRLLPVIRIIGGSNSAAAGGAHVAACCDAWNALVAARETWCRTSGQVRRQLYPADLSDKSGARKIEQRALDVEDDYQP